MRPLLINVALAFIWMGIMGDMSAGNFVVGFAIAYVILIMQQSIVGQSTYYRKINGLVHFVLFFILEILLSSVRVALAAFFPKHYVRPGIVAVPLDAKSDFEIVLLACVVTLTPGSLSVDVSEDRSTLFVHCMTVKHPDQIRRSIKYGLERRLLEVLR